MDTRNDPGVSIQRDTLEVVVSPPDAPPEVVNDLPATRSRRPLSLLAVVVALAVAATVAAVVLTGDDDVVATPGTSQAAVPEEVSALTVTVTPPTSVVAGQEATFAIAYADDEGVFSGGTEDWGDGLATSSLKQSSCDVPASGSPPGAAAGSYQVGHTFAEAGTYQLELGVRSYTCVDGTAVEEVAIKTFAVTVAAP